MHTHRPNHLLIYPSINKPVRSVSTRPSIPLSTHLLIPLQSLRCLSIVIPFDL